MSLPLGLMIKTQHIMYYSWIIISFELIQLISAANIRWKPRGKLILLISRSGLLIHELYCPLALLFDGSEEHRTEFSWKLWVCMDDFDVRFESNKQSACSQMSWPLLKFIRKSVEWMVSWAVLASDRFCVGGTLSCGWYANGNDYSWRVSRLSVEYCSLKLTLFELTISGELQRRDWRKKMNFVFTRFIWVVNTQNDLQVREPRNLITSRKLTYRSINQSHFSLRKDSSQLHWKTSNRCNEQMFMCQMMQWPSVKSRTVKTSLHATATTTCAPPTGSSRRLAMSLRAKLLSRSRVQSGICLFSPLNIDEFAFLPHDKDATL